jgi:hypothetical protein
LWPLLLTRYCWRLTSTPTYGTGCCGQVSHDTRLKAAQARVKLQCTLLTPRCRTFLIRAIVFNQPKHSSIRFLFFWLDGVAPVLRGAAIDRATTAPSQVQRRVRHHPQMAALLHKPERVIAFVASHRQRLRAGKSFHHDQGCIAFCGPVRLENLRVYDQSVAVLHQQIAAVTQLRLFPAAFARQQGVGIGLGLMRFVRALLSAEVHRGIARIIRRKRGLALFDLKSLPSRLGFQQRTVHGEMLVAGQAP